MHERPLAAVAHAIAIAAAGATLVAQATRAPAAAGPVKYSVTINGVLHTSASTPSFQIARGSAEGTHPGADLLGFVPDDPKAGAKVSSQPRPGLHQAIDDVKPDQPITVLVGAVAEIPGSGGRLTVVNLIVQGVSKAALARLPLTAPIRPIRQPAPAGPTAMARASHNGTPYEAASGQVVIEAIDFAARTVRGTFALTTGGSLVGGRPPLQITAGRFEK